MKYNIYQCTAKYWQEKGISVVPCYYRSKKPMIKWTWLKEGLPTTKQISKWFGPDKKYNLALLTTDRLVVLDFDCPTQYAYWYCWQVEHNPQVLDTYVVTTNRGLHLYYCLEQPLTEKIKCQSPYEIKSHGRLITIPPSVHPSGTLYRAINSPNDILTVGSIKDVLTFSPVKIKKPVVRNNDPWRIQPNGNGPIERINLLDLFPEARQTDDEGIYFITDCPIHGHRNNFMLNVKDNVCYCYAGCGSFLATELLELIGDNYGKKAN